MWCKSCRQDVPGIASFEGRFCCARCGTLMGAAHGATVAAEVAMASSDASATESPALFDRWELEQQLKHVERVLDLARLMHEYPPAGTPATNAHEKRYHVHPAAAQSGVKKQRANARKPQPVMSFVAWSSMAVGMVAFTCGSALCGWGYLAGRDDLWDLGLPIAPSGQIGVLAGVLIQLYRLWRRGSAALDQMPELQAHRADDNDHRANDDLPDSDSDADSTPLAGPHWNRSSSHADQPSRLEQLADEMILAPQLLRELRGGMDRLSQQISRPKRS